MFLTFECFKHGWQIAKHLFNLLPVFCDGKRNRKENDSVTVVLYPLYTHSLTHSLESLARVFSCPCRTQEIKECAITSMGLLLAHLASDLDKQLPEVLTVC